MRSVMHKNKFNKTGYFENLLLKLQQNLEKQMNCNFKYTLFRYAVFIKAKKLKLAPIVERLISRSRFE